MGIPHWYPRLPEHLRDSGVSLSDRGVFETAFPIAVAGQVVTAIAEMGVVILGGDFWKSTGEGMRPTYENWIIERLPAESVHERHSRSIELARRAIADKDDEALYVVFVCATDLY